MVHSVTTMTADVLRRLQNLFCDSREKGIIVQVHPDLSRRLRGVNKDLLERLAKDFKRTIRVESVSDFHIHEIRVMSGRTRKEIANLSV